MCKVESRARLLALVRARVGDVIGSTLRVSTARSSRFDPVVRVSVDTGLVDDPQSKLRDLCASFGTTVAIENILTRTAPIGVLHFHVIFPRRVAA